MQTSLKDQINAVREAMEVARRDGVTELYESLNDAASSLAYLNLTKDLEPKEEKIKRLIQQKIDALYVKFWNPETPFSEASEIDKAIGTLQELLKEIETL